MLSRRRANIADASRDLLPSIRRDEAYHAPQTPFETRDSFLVSGAQIVSLGVRSHLGVYNVTPTFVGRSRPYAPITSVVGSESRAEAVQIARVWVRDLNAAIIQYIRTRCSRKRYLSLTLMLHDPKVMCSIIPDKSALSQSNTPPPPRPSWPQTSVPIALARSFERCSLGSTSQVYSECPTLSRGNRHPTTPELVHRASCIKQERTRFPPTSHSN
jgi:hypothetical protein